MDIRTGCDVVHLPRFRHLLTEDNGTACARLFTSSERGSTKSSAHFAGLFALKEATMKALNLPPESWQTIEIHHSDNGKPAVHLLEAPSRSIESHDASISHDGDYVLATVAFLLSDEA